MWKACVWCLYVLCLILLGSTKDNVEAKIISKPSTEFSRHRIVQPTVHHARTKREITNTRHKQGTHHREVTVRLPIDGQEYTLDLRLNEDLIPDGHVVRYQKNGTMVTHKPTIEDLDLCQYHGKIKGIESSWVALSTCHGIRGLIFDGKKMRYIQPVHVQANDIQSDHYIYDHADLTTHHKCGYEGGVTKNESYDPLLLKKHTEQKNVERSRISRHKREASDTQVRGPYNANKQSRYVELVLVSDHREFRANGESLRTVHHQLKDVANIINSVYAPLNIFIALVGVVVWNEGDEIELGENGDETLNHFLTYRKMKLLGEIPNDNAHLITRQKFKEGVVGKALKGPICTYDFSGGVATNHSEVIGLVATTIAHEMGHNFGMEHDTELDCTCPDEKCIMNPSSTSVTPVHWSSCSLKSLALAFERGMDYCLRNKPKRIFDSPTCGNGFVEPGEQCDCGTAIDDKPNPCHACCDPNTCMLRSNATCAAGACCDLDSCRPKSAGTVCRSADRECDLPEYCTGHSEYCPADVYKMDSTPCSVGQAYCVRGSCRTHGDQCRLLWGATGEDSDQRCYYNNNVKGNKNGNCGLLRAQQRYKACSVQDSLCGLLHCRHLNERLEFGMDSIATLAAVFINNNGTIIPCRTAMIDLGLSDIDPGMVPDGAKCGTDRMCMNQKCVSVEAVREGISRRRSSVCPSDCSGRGVCNSEGHCHCEAGFGAPLCALPGPGGSEDSGPATNPNVQRNFMITMYVIFLGILPTILLALFLFYYSRHNVIFWWNKPRKSYVHNLVAGKKFFTLPNFKRKTTLHTNTTQENDSHSLGLGNIFKNSKLATFLTPKENKKTLKKIHRKINKDDIEIATDGDVNKPMIDKPKKKTNIVIDKTGLTSTTNEMVSDKSRSRLHSITELHKNYKFLSKLQRTDSKGKPNERDVNNDAELLNDKPNPIVKPKPSLKPIIQSNEFISKLNVDKTDLPSNPRIDAKNKSEFQKNKELFTNIHRTDNKKFIKNVGIINKDDIELADDTKVEVVPKPKTAAKPSEIKPSVSIVRGDLTSTTNAIVSDTKNRCRLRSIKRQKSDSDNKNNK